MGLELGGRVSSKIPPCSLLNRSLLANVQKEVPGPPLLAAFQTSQYTLATRAVAVVASVAVVVACATAACPTAACDSTVIATCL